MSDGERVGIVGLGNMGGALARSLVEGGYDVVGCDIASSRRALLEEAGGSTVDRPADVLEHAELVVLSLPSAAALDEVVSGSGGLIEHPRPGAVLAETSTLALADKDRARALLADAQMVLLDCPISGTGGQARARDIVVYASGPTEAFLKIEPALRSTSRDVLRVGDFGAGTKVKFVHNLMVAIHTMAAAEALNLVRSVGLDVDATFGLLTAGASTSRMLEVRGPMMVADDYPGDSATLHTLSKDVGLIRAFAEEAGVPTPLLSLVSTFLTAGRGRGLSDADPAVIARVLAAMSPDDHTEQASSPGGDPPG